MSATAVHAAPCSARRSTSCTSRWAPGWCRSPATRCRCSTRRASSRSTCTRALVRGCSMSRTWARRSCRAGSRHDRGGAGGAGAGRHPRPGARPAALHAAPQRRRRHHRRPDGDALRFRGGRRQPDAGGERLAQGGGLRAYRGAAAGRRQAAAGAERALLALQGPAAADVLAKLSDVRRACGS